MNKIQLSGSAIIKEGKLLLLFRKKHGHYEFPGGKVQEGEGIEQTALRETKEEIGCDVKIVEYLGYYDFYIDNQNFRSHIYLAQIPAGQNPKITEPELFREIFWLPIKDFKKYQNFTGNHNLFNNRLCYGIRNCTFEPPAGTQKSSRLRNGF
jgi:8-oxo-dGTP diphosphatase